MTTEIKTAGTRSKFAGLDFVWVPNGSFMMGSPENEEMRNDDELLHLVNISQGFWLGRTPITQIQWETVMGKNPSRFVKNSFLNSTKNHPVESISWECAHNFIEKLNNQDQGHFSLPTEAQWEHACRYGGKIEEQLQKNNAKQLGWYATNSQQRTHPVTQKKANGLGLYDMLGNVWEWTSDWYGPYDASTQTDPIGASSGISRVRRGGSWRDPEDTLRCSYRLGYSPDRRLSGLGLRILRKEDEV